MSYQEMKMDTMEMTLAQDYLELLHRLGYQNAFDFSGSNLNFLYTDKEGKITFSAGYGAFNSCNAPEVDLEHLRLMIHEKEGHPTVKSKVFSLLQLLNPFRMRL